MRWYGLLVESRCVQGSNFDLGIQLEVVFFPFVVLNRTFRIRVTCCENTHKFLGKIPRPIYTNKNKLPCSFTKKKENKSKIEYSARKTNS